MGALSFASPPQALSPPDDLSCITNMTDGVRTSATSLSTNSEYPELTTPYSAVSSFNYPTRADSTLLTPISSSGSPPIHQTKFAGRYPSEASHPGVTSPDPHRMYSNWNHFDVNGQPPHTSSPMPPQTTVAQDYMPATYLNDDRRPTPGPPEPYTGMYGVSDSNEPHGLHSGAPYYLGMPMSIEADTDPGRTQMPTPLLTQAPSPSMRGQQRRLNGEGAVFPGGPEDSRPASGRRHLSTTRVRKHKNTGRKGSVARASTSGDSSEEHKNCRGVEEPPMIKDTCPPEERCIFESRWRHRHKKGHDMWDSIQDDYTKQFDKTPGKEMLQMKYKRGRSKYYEWLPEDEDILKRAFVEFERKRYEMLLEKFLEMGGSRNLELNQSDIELKIVTGLKLEEGFYLEGNADVNARRRRKLSTRQRNGTRGEDGLRSPHNDLIMHHGVNEDEILHQIHSRQDRDRAAWSDGSGLSPEMVDIQMQMKMEPGLVPEHVARQQHEHQQQRLRNGSYSQRR